MVKRTQILLRRQEMIKLEKLCEESGLSACEVIRVLINNAAAIKLSVYGKQKAPAKAEAQASGTCKPDASV